MATMSKTYDYIICGGGTSGCALAGRLADIPSISVLLIEAGDHSDNVPATKMAGGSQQIVGSEHDWNIIDEPCSGLNGRQTPLSRGKVLGGSSTLNGTLCIRGLKADYDQWDLEGWSGDEVFEYMKKAETFRGKKWFRAESSVHGSQGPVHTEPHDLAPISSRLLDSFQSKGVPFQPDMFSTGDVVQGVGHALRTVGNGFRMTAANYVTQSKARENLTVLAKTLIDRIVLEKNDGKLKATGVEVLSAAGEKTVYSAKHEIILSAGAYGSPAILLRSGIGPEADVSSYGIQHQLHLPGVGKNLQDHLIAFTFYQVSEPNLTTDHQIWHQGALDRSVQQWMTDQTGFLSTFPFGCFAYARLDDRLVDSPEWRNASRESASEHHGRDPMGLSRGQPNIEFFNTECYGGSGHIFDKFPIDGSSAFALITELFSPRSRGTVELKSSDPKDNPIVHHNYLQDPLDVLVLAEGCRLGNEIVMHGSGTKDIIKGSWPPNLAHHEYTDRKQWMDFVRDNSTTCYHPAATCAMGNDDNPMAVLDNQLKVRGILGLRVADVSAMPTLNSGHPQMVAYAIGEKAADLLKAEYGV